MTQQLSILDSFDAEVAQLRARFADAAGVLEQLSNIRDELATVAQTHAQLTKALDTAERRWAVLEHELEASVERSDEARAGLDGRFAELQEMNDVRWDALRAELGRVQEQLLSAHRNTRAELGAQITELAGDLERRLDAARTAMEAQRSETAARLDATEQHLRASESVADRAARQTGTLRMYALGAGLLGLIAVVLALVAVLIAA